MSTPTSGFSLRWDRSGSPNKLVFVARLQEIGAGGADACWFTNPRGYIGNHGVSHLLEDSIIQGITLGYGLREPCQDKVCRQAELDG